VPENPRIEELRRRVQADPASIAFAALAEEFRRVGRYDEAIEACRTGLQRHPAYLSARVTLGRALIETGDYAGAREELETVLRSAPENIAAIRGLEQINERLGHSTEMHPDLAALANEPIRVAPPTTPDLPRASETTALSDSPPVQPAPPISLDSFNLPMTSAPAAADTPQKDEPFDIFGAALQASASAGEPEIDATPEPITFEAPFDGLRAAPSIAEGPPPLAFEAATISFEAPVMPLQPDAHVAAALTRLERFLGAIQAARHA
jgi:tetratricopeptide (TPR) repeat protein